MRQPDKAVSSAPPGREERAVPLRRRVVDRFAAWMAVAALLAGILLYYPFGEVFEFDPDEGIELMKARLVAAGYELYEQVWSDQPPLFTYVLTGWLELFGWTAFAGRLLILLTAALLLGSLYRILQSSWGHAHAIAALVLLLLSAHFLPRSVSVMFILPMHAFIMLALYVLVRAHGASRTWPLLISALALAVAVQVKFAAIILVPLLAIAVPLISRASRAAKPWPKRALIPTAAWIATFLTATGIATFGLIGSNHLSHVIAPHRAAESAGVFPGGPRVLWGMLRQDADFALLALVGTITVVLRRRWRSLLPLGWLALVVPVLMIHRPLWAHYYLFLSIPFCWLAGIAVGELFTLPRRSAWLPSRDAARCGGAVLRWAGLGLLVMTAFNLPEKLERITTPLSRESDARNRELVARMKKYAGKTKWVVTDRQIVPFYADLIVPPELSVTSLKRLATKNLTPSQVLQAVRKYRPEQIYFDGSRIPLTPNLREFLRRRYRLIAEDRGARHFIRIDIARTAPP